MSDEFNKAKEKFFESVDVTSLGVIQGADEALYEMWTAARAHGGGVPSLEWAVKRCQALQDQGFDRVRLDVLEKTFRNAIEGSRSHSPPKEWVRCEDRLPTEADGRFNGLVWFGFLGKCGQLEGPFLVDWTIVTERRGGIWHSTPPAIPPQPPQDREGGDV